MLNPALPTPESAYAEIERRVGKFKALSKREREAYNEDNTRKDFIMPLFRALGWDITDSREVAAEEKVSRGRVDFSFRIGGVPRFFLETKRISEDLTKREFVQQAINYAWTKGVTWALLSDFEGLRVFNAEWKESDPLQAQFLEFNVDTYLPEFERLWWLSRPETERKRLDSEAEKAFKKTPRTPIAQTLFDHLLRVRKELYTNFQVYNKTLFKNPKLIDDAVQRMLDRLIFIRTAEDRGVEPERLIALIRETPHDKLLAALYQRFRDLDGVYNSQLFAPNFMDRLDCEPSLLSDVIDGLYHSKANAADYAFDAIDSDVLGRVYEQYLGYVFSEQVGAIDRSPLLEAKRAKRKSQGIYYTPTFVAKYIVQQTLGRYLEENGYNPSRPVRVLDPACGSGSFLIEAFDVLDQYVANQRGQASGKYDIQDHARQVKLLTQCIYGVDKDEQAVEVARLNLLLKALHTRDRLPMLKHIAQGDSLISGADEELEKYFGAKWKEKKPFDWEQEFKEAMKDGGFDVIVGNPPYVATEMIGSVEKAYFRSHTDLTGKELNLFALFLELSLRLCVESGMVGFILPDSVLTARSYQSLRRLILDTCLIKSIVFIPGGAFEDALLGNSVILALQKQRLEEARKTNEIQTLAVSGEHQINVVSHIRQSTYSHTPDNSFFLDANAISFMERLKAVGVELGQIAEIKDGVKTGDNERFVSRQRNSRASVKVLRGSDISRYRIDFGGYYLRYDRSHLAQPSEERIFLAKEKIIVRQTGDRIIAAFDDAKFYTLDNTHLILMGGMKRTCEILLSLLNSRLMDVFYQALAAEKGRLYAQVRIANLQQLPIRRINFDDAVEKKQHDHIVALVEQMLQVQKEYSEASALREDRRLHLKDSIDELDAEIDQEVFELYGLTEEEIEVVKGGEKA